MTEVRIAHFSDTHVLCLAGTAPRHFLNKRWTGAVNLALNRKRHYRVEVFELLLAALVECAVDHTVCTGDLVNLALEPEFERVARMLREAFAPRSMTLVPGNHDYYVKEAVYAGCFERWFADYLPHDLGGSRGLYPVSRMLDQVAIIGLCTGVASGLLLATGEVGAAQMRAAQYWLTRPEVKARFRLVMIHHPLVDGGFGRLRRLVDAERVRLGLRESGCDLVVHGHNHVYRRYTLPGTSTPVIQVASASLAGKRASTAEFNVYVIDAGKLVRVERHIHDPDSGRFRCVYG